MRPLALIGYLSNMVVTTNRLIAFLFLVLLIGAAVFSFERILFADASFILFNIINGDSLQIQEHRYGSFITQGIPLLAARLQLPLAAIIVLYSLSFNLFYLAVVVLLLYRFKETNLAILMAFYFTLFVSDTYFWVNNEVHQGIAWMFLFFATTQALGKQKTHWAITFPIFALLSFLTLYTHPLLIFPAGYLWLFFLSQKGWPYRRWQTTCFSLILLLMAVSKLYLSAGASSHYDADKLHNVTHLSVSSIVDSLSSSFTSELLQRMAWNYWIIPVLSVTGLYAAFRKKAYWQLLLTVSFLLTYFVALCLTFNDFLPFYTESELMPATIMLTVPFVYYSLPDLKRGLAPALLAAIFFVRLAYIGYASQEWVERKEWLENTLQTMREKRLTKGMIQETGEHKNSLFITWGTPVESIIASALHDDKPQRTFVIDNEANLQSRIPTEKTYMAGSFETIHYNRLNKRYFSFDTTASYQWMQVKEEQRKED